LEKEFKNTAACKKSIKMAKVRIDCGVIEEEEEFNVVNISSYRAVDIELPLIGLLHRFVKTSGNPKGHLYYLTSRWR